VDWAVHWGLSRLESVLHGILENLLFSGPNSGSPGEAPRAVVSWRAVGPQLHRNSSELASRPLPPTPLSLRGASSHDPQSQ
jgi:hypothetical protein